LIDLHRVLRLTFRTGNHRAARPNASCNLGLRFGSACTTGPPMNVGATPLNALCLGYKATTSQMWPSLTQQFGWSSGRCLRSASATRWSRSQYCAALASEIRNRVMLVGLSQSVGNIGSQTINTRTSRDGSSFSKPSMAEAPRKHVGQVGESRASTRTCCAESSKLFSNCVKLLSLSTAIGGCPCGRRRLPNTCQARKAATDSVNTPAKIRLLFMALWARITGRLPGDDARD
jgi:hypothetical protein